jgi:hypothetical protein
MSSAIHCATCFQPAACHGFERTERPAVTPADREVDVARGVGDVGQVIGGVVEGVAEAGPQELRLRMFARAQGGELLRGVAFLQQLGDRRIEFARARAVILLRKIDDEDVLAALGVEARAGLLAERALRNQCLQPRGRGEVGMPRIVRQRVGHRLDHVRHRVQAHDVRGAIGRRLRTADRRARERIDGVEAQTEALRVVHRGQHREHADAVADEVRRVLRVDHALAERGDEEGFQAFEDLRIGGLRRNQFGQVHVTRRVEEVHAAEAVAQRFGQHAGQAR